MDDPWGDRKRREEEMWKRIFNEWADEQWKNFKQKIGGWFIGAILFAVFSGCLWILMTANGWAPPLRHP